MSKAYYNEFDRHAAAWLRELIKDGLIADGDVDERSITDVQPSDLNGYTQCHFFAGIGGWSYALRLAGWPDDQPVWTGSCPCQPFSVAGKGLGEADPRHLWPQFGRLIGQCRPPIAFGEQVASKAGRPWLALVQADLEAMGYRSAAADLCAAGIGAPHIRQRLYWVADCVCQGGSRLEPRPNSSILGHGGWCSKANLQSIASAPFERGDCWPAPLLRRVGDGLPGGVGRQSYPKRVEGIKGYGNAIVPQLAAEFIVVCCECL